MTRKILIDNYADVLEAKCLPELKRTYSYKDSNVVCNPITGVLMNKTVIVSLPLDLPLNQLRCYNTIISRFKICPTIPVIPYVMPEVRKEITKDEISCLILSPFMMIDNNYLKYMKENFILGVHECIDGDATAIGKKIVENKIEELIK